MIIALEIYFESQLHFRMTCQADGNAEGVSCFVRRGRSGISGRRASTSLRLRKQRDGTKELNEGWETENLQDSGVAGERNAVTTFELPDTIGLNLRV